MRSVAVTVRRPGASRAQATSTEHGQTAVVKQTENGSHPPGKDPGTLAGMAHAFL